MSRLTSTGLTTLLNKVESYIDMLHNGAQEEDLTKFSFVLDQTKSDPSAMVTEVSHLTTLPMMDSWMSLLGLRPCILRNGEVVSYLNINNYNEDIDGNPVDLTVLGDDVMLEIPRMGYKVEKLDTDISKFTISLKPNDPSLDYSAFSLDDWGDCDKLYYGIYKGYVDDNKLYSVAGKTPSASYKLVQFRTFANARGTGYTDVSYAADALLQILYCLTVQQLNAQVAVGHGNCNNRSRTTIVDTGGSETYGPFMQSTDSTIRARTTGIHAKCLGIEDPWGNINQLEDGLIAKYSVQDSSFGAHNIYRAKCASDFNSTGNDYIKVGTFLEVSSSYTNNQISGYVSKMTDGIGGVFLPAVFNGSSSTFFCDYSYLGASDSIPIYGGSAAQAEQCGMFRRSVSDSTTFSREDAGSRLMYLHKEQE
jgi:hypothetical protein